MAWGSARCVEAERLVDVGGADDLRKEPVVAQRSVVGDGLVDDVPGSDPAAIVADDAADVAAHGGGQGLRRPARPAGLIDTEMRQSGVPGPHPARHLPVPDERVSAKLGAVALGEVEHPVGVREVEGSGLGLDVLPLELVARTERVEVLSEEAPRAGVGKRTGLGAEGRHLGPEGDPMTVRGRSGGGAGQGEHQGELGGERETNPHRGPPFVVARNPSPGEVGLRCRLPARRLGRGGLGPVYWRSTLGLGGRRSRARQP